MTKDQKATNGRHLFLKSVNHKDWMKEELPKAREAKCMELGVEKLTAQQQFSVYNALSTKGWNQLTIEEKAEWSEKAKNEVKLGVSEENM